MNYDFINILNNGNDLAPEMELYFSINERQLLHYYEPELGLFVVESPMVIERALNAGYRPVSYVMIDTVAEEMCEKFSKIMDDTKDEWDEKVDSIPVYVGDYETIAGMTGVNITRGVLALMKRRELPALSDVIENCSRIAVFDDVENPTNIGAMFRSAAALGIEAIVLAGQSCDPLYRRASRVSTGTVFQVPWTIVSSGKGGGNSAGEKAGYVRLLKDAGFTTAAMALSDDSVNIDDPSLKQSEKIAIIMGNEGYGLSDDVIRSCDYVVKIPMKNNVDSLNVAAASTIAFWEITR